MEHGQIRIGFSSPGTQVSQHFQIAIKELIPVLIATVIWGKKWKGCLVVANCDNEAVVVILNSRCSKDPHLMHMLRTLFFIESHYQFKITAKHIPNTLNTLADHLSRHKLEHFYDYHRTASHYPSCIPKNLLQWLPGWTGRQVIGPSSSALLSARHSRIN